MKAILVWQFGTMEFGVAIGRDRLNALFYNTLSELSKVRILVWRYLLGVQSSQTKPTLDGV